MWYGQRISFLDKFPFRALDVEPEDSPQNPERSFENACSLL